MSAAPRPGLAVLALFLVVLPSVSAAQVPTLADAKDLAGLVADATLPLPLPGEPAPPAEPARGDAASWTLPGRVVVGFDEDATLLTPALAALAATMGGRVVRVDALLDFAVVAVPEGEAQRLVKEAGRLHGVKYAQPDTRVEASFIPDDPLYPAQWGAPALGMADAWNVTRGSRNVTVAILDTGVWSGHPDLAANLCVEGPDYSNGDADPEDDHGHGTHVAGTVAAAINNGVGVAGMADACLMSVKVLNGGGSGSFADLASAIAWAADNGADVVSMSLGGCPGCDPGSPTRDAVEYADAAGVLLVAAAGNWGCAPVSYPAAYPQVVAVAALQPPGNERAYFSDCGPEVELSAPGVDVVSTSLTEGPLSHPSGYMNLSGTSMATPHVSGVAALVWSHHANLTSDGLRCLLAQTAHDLGAAGRDAQTGYGRVDPVAALAAGACVPTLPDAPVLAASLTFSGGDEPTNDTSQPTRLVGGESWALPLDARDRDDANATTRDASPHGRHADVVGAVPTAGPHGEALLFDGAGHHVTIPHTGPMPEGTVMFWVRNDDPSELGAFFKQAPGVWNDLSVYVGTRVHFNTQQPSQGLETAPGSIVTGQWHHVAVTWGSAGKRVYIDGALAASNNDTTGVGPTSWITMLGNSPNDVGTGGFIGAFDEVRQYEWALDATTIQSLLALPYQGGDEQHRAVLSWTVPGSLGSDVASYRVHQGQDGGPLAVVAEVGPGTTSYVLGPLAEGTTYAFAVSATNGLGEGPLSNVVNLTPLAPLPLPYENGFETDAEGWATSGLWHLTTDRSASPLNSWYYGNENGPGLDDNSYNVGATSGGLVSPPFDLRGVPDGLLSFWSWWEGEGGNWEKPTVQVSTSGPSGPWTTAYSDPAWKGEDVVHVDLTPWEGSVVHLRFLWDTRDAIANHHEGWYVDDVRVVRGEAPVSCGGDAFGNDCVVIPYAFEDVSGVGTALPLLDDELKTVPLPFAFEHYGQSYAEVGVSSNGFLDFGQTSGSGCCEGQPIPNSTAPNAIVAAFWADLDPNASGSVSYATLGAPGERVFVVQWTGVPLFCCDPASNNTFQVKLFEATGDVEVHYQNVDALQWGGASAGIEGCKGLDGIGLFHGNFAISSTGIRYEPGNGTPDACTSEEYVPLDAQILSPANGAVLSGVVTVAGVTNGTEGAPVQTYVWVNGILHHYRNGTGPWNFSLDTTLWSDGEYPIWVDAYDGSAYDGAGVWVTFDNQPDTNEPALATITSPQNNATLASGFSVHGTAWDAEGNVTQVRVRVDGTTWNATGTANWTVPSVGALDEGWHVVAASAHDGVQWGSEYAIWVYVDNTPPYHAPTVAITEPSEGDALTGVVTVKGTAAAHPDHWVALVQVRVDGGEWESAAGWTNWSYGLDTRSLANGTHVIEARSFDGWSFSDLANVTVTVSNDDTPFATITSPRPGASVGGLLVARGHAQAGARVEVRIDGGAWLPTMGGSSWSRYVDTRDLADGLHDLEARSVEGDVVSETALVQFFVSNGDGPIVRIDSPDADEVVSGFVTVEGGAFPGQDRDVLRVEVSLDGVEWRVADGTDAWSARLDVRGAWWPSYHAIVARAWDGRAYGYDYVYVQVDNRHDYVVSSLEVERNPVRTEAGDAPNLVNEQRTVRFTVRNDGATTAPGAMVRVYVAAQFRAGATHAYREDTLDHEVVPVLAAGASATYEATWDTTLFVGDADVVVEITPFWGSDERDVTNNAATLRTYVRAGGLGGANLDPTAA